MVSAPPVPIALDENVFVIRSSMMVVFTTRSDTGRSGVLTWLDPEMRTLSVYAPLGPPSRLKIAKLIMLPVGKVVEASICAHE